MAMLRRVAAAALLLVGLPALVYLQRPAPARAQDEVEALRARVADLEATELALRQELAREREWSQSLRTERDALSAALAAARADIARLQGGDGGGTGTGSGTGTGTGTGGGAASGGAGAEAGVIRLQVGRPEVQAGDTWYALDVPPTIVADRVMLPVRAVAELLGLEVEWDGATRTVTLRR